MASHTLRIFVSATSADLGSYRKEVSEQLKCRDCHAVDQDHSSPDYRTLQQLLTRKIRSCDAVICLVGIAFGKEVPLRGFARKRQSYTQMEYRLAKKLGKPVFLFIASEDCQFDGELHEDEDNVLCQKAYRQELRNGPQRYDEFHNVSDLKLQIGHTDFAQIPRRSKISTGLVAWSAALLAIAAAGAVVYSNHPSTAIIRPNREARLATSASTQLKPPVRTKVSSAATKFSREEAARQLEAAQNEADPKRSIGALPLNRLDLENVDAMIEAGYLERISYSIYSYSITNKGKTALAAIKPVRVETLTGPHLETAVKIPRRVEVTGMEVQSDGSAEVEYTVYDILPAEWPDSIKEMFRQKRTGCNAVFRLWDDAWRIEQS